MVHASAGTVGSFVRADSFRVRRSGSSVPITRSHFEPKSPESITMGCGASNLSNDDIETAKSVRLCVW